MSSAIPLPISMSEYLRSSYEPDCDYVDGIIEQRNAGSPEQVSVERALMKQIEQHTGEWGVRAVCDTRVQTSASHVRVADIALLTPDNRQEKVIESPPVAVIEILSRGDNVPRHTERLEDFRRMGVKNLWAVDPVARKGLDASSGEWRETGSFAVPESSIRIDLAAVFATLV